MSVNTSVNTELHNQCDLVPCSVSVWYNTNDVTYNSAFVLLSMQSSESLFPEHKKKKTERKIFQADWIGSASMSKWWIICRRPKRAWTGSSPFNWCQELKQSEVFVCQTARVQSIKHDPAFIWGMFLITECHKWPCRVWMVSSVSTVSPGMWGQLSISNQCWSST